MSEVGTVVWKEWREHFLRRGRPSRTVVATLVLVVLGGLVAPLVIGLSFSRFLSAREVVEIVAGIGLFATAFQGMVLNVSLIIDAFAGERERHTLESLLASPLSDRAILVGKILAIQLFVLVASLVEVVSQQGILLILFGAPGWGYLPVLVAGPILAGLVGLLIGSIGAMVGMRVATVKAGQQVMAYILLPVYFLPGLGNILLQSTPPGRAILAYYALVGPQLFVLTVMGLLLTVDVLLLALARRAFRRNRLLLIRR